MKNLFLVIVCIAAFISCSSNPEKVSTESIPHFGNTEIGKLMQVDVNSLTEEQLKDRTNFRVKDSLLTKEQLEKKIQFADFWFKNVKVTGNQIQLSCGREEFHKNGIPELYYDVLTKEFESHNKNVDASDPVFFIDFSFEKLFEESKEDYPRYREELLGYIKKKSE